MESLGLNFLSTKGFVQIILKQLGLVMTQGAVLKHRFSLTSLPLPLAWVLGGCVAKQEEEGGCGTESFLCG